LPSKTINERQIYVVRNAQNLTFSNVEIQLLFFRGRTPGLLLQRERVEGRVSTFSAYETNGLKTI
jgi:hypothetical protein